MVNFMPDGRGSGAVTGNPLIDEKLAQAQAAGAITPGFAGAGSSEYDKYRQYFQAPDPTLSERGISWIDRLLNPPAPEPKLPDVSIFGISPGPGAKEMFDRFVGDPERERREREERPQREAERQAREAHAERNAQRTRLEELAKQALLIGDDYLPSELDAIWQAAIDQAEASSKMGGTHVEPWEILEFWAKDPAQARKYGGLQPSAPDLPEDLEPRTSTSTSTVTNLSTPEAADAVLRRGLRSTLGRKPTDVEFEAFRLYLNDLESDNPTVTETTTTMDPTTGDSTSESTTSGGAPAPTAAADEFVEDDDFADEAFAYQMGTEGADIMRQLVGGLA